MEVNQIQQLNSIMSTAKKNNVNQATPAEAQQSFKTWLNNAISEVNEGQNNSAIMTEKVARGENVDLHDVMITAEKASVMLQTTTEVRNKAIEAYQEIMRMQV
ncbi:flagellar hook-basal body complex protein FliE [Salipaludibacillus agaradhaerens]|uniref:Flagellar hook-basal body complex protein FliE n=1 Tax=Salipaludibacillus agaradhaerens TaxID=76935 RepID=A0A9Q4B0D9_SALAG|nr:flagellar hook-basal body complex protein FliE [Salipaludibacillus agaradhaerens]UJW58156.1 flagellar hook-basal body complex protein FliE [Bacillus sp. A116_S68]MCR6096038.1 flagellar hook-basal body complex protein FliE [Salipaludibacillus agaradhaerens]MCR6107074.1 flagellar hook-basal body complex protein FliE [Salipaludibacillus agaradhaerens]MCR6114403.1 flagellar hook-basal body complex protein FliE [Salipaludibacillus agaradhaerens]MCR6119105.1 flagellar hook-basal body complex prot